VLRQAADQPPAEVGSGPTRRRYSAPLVVGVTGHRDLAPAEIPGIRGRVREFLMHLHSEYPDRDLVVLTPLAEGADRLVANEALDLGLPVTVVLPMPRALYAEDFRTVESRAEFDRLCAAATDLFELPLTAGNTPGSVDGHGPNRARQYAQLGVFLSAHCHVLLALWDGRESTETGGTAQVVRFHQDDIMPGFAPRSAASRLTLADDESDLVYHIVCSRDRPGHTPAPGLEPLDCAWYTRDDAEPRTRELPAKYRQIFDRTAEFNTDVQRHVASIDREGYPLLPREPVAGQRLQLRQQRRVLGGLRQFLEFGDQRVGRLGPGADALQRFPRSVEQVFLGAVAHIAGARPVVAIAARERLVLGQRGAQVGQRQALLRATVGLELYRAGGRQAVERRAELLARGEQLEPAGRHGTQGHGAVTGASRSARTASRPRSRCRSSIIRHT